MFPFFSKKTPPPKFPADKIDSDAVGILRRLNKEGYEAYLVGGGVRDLLLGIEPKDFDIATNARPRQVSRLWRNAFVIGKRFKIVIVTFPEKGKQIEVATFRRAPEYSENFEPAGAKRGELYQTDDNEFGTIEEDVLRRDFTANALYYDYSRDQVVDFEGGLGDLSRKVLRCIGDPAIRFREDPVRMIRAVRLAAKLDFAIDKASLKAIAAHASEISLAAKPRLFDEVVKIYSTGCSEAAFRHAWSSGLLKQLLPGVASHISDSGGKSSVFWDFLAAFDKFQKDGRVAAGAAGIPGAASIIPLATTLAPLYLAKHAKAGKREHLARDLVAQNLVAQFSNKLFSQPQSLFRNIAFQLSTLPEYRITARVPRRDQREILPIARLIWEICATALGDAKGLSAIKRAAEQNDDAPLVFTPPARYDASRHGDDDPDGAGDDSATENAGDSDESNASDNAAPPSRRARAPRPAPAPAETDASDAFDAFDASEDEEDDGLGLDLKRGGGSGPDSPLATFIKTFSTPALTPAFQALHRDGKLTELLPEPPAPEFWALLSALDARRETKNLSKKSWRLVLPLAVIAAPAAFAANAAAHPAPAPEDANADTAPDANTNADAPPDTATSTATNADTDANTDTDTDANTDADTPAPPPFAAPPLEAIATAADDALASIFENLTRDKHTYSTIRKRASQVLQTLFMDDPPQHWLADLDLYRAIRAICVEALPGYAPPEPSAPPPRSSRSRSRRRRRGSGAGAASAADFNNADTPAP